MFGNPEGARSSREGKGRKRLNARKPEFPMTDRSGGVSVQALSSFLLALDSACPPIQAKFLLGTCFLSAGVSRTGSCMNRTLSLTSYAGQRRFGT